MRVEIVRGLRFAKRAAEWAIVVAAGPATGIAGPSIILSEK